MVDESDVVVNKEKSRVKNDDEKVNSTLFMVNLEFIW